MQRVVYSAIIAVMIILVIPVTGTSGDMAANSSANAAQQDIQVIPDEAIRLRILADSDAESDQELKHKVRDNVNAAITDWVGMITDIDKARELIAANIPEIRTIVEDTLKEEGSSQSSEVEYGKNITFPAKLYGSYLYPPGEYEAVLITLGEGEGSNWWCVLFPPLCFLDFSSGSTVAEAEETETGDDDDDKEDDEEEASDEEETDVRFFLFEWFD
ncbi:stage II sporulation protein R [Barrientosiimonas marina]|uniref:Stage II sporulation protein R n=1 Tax=Lentibacillus kimchii TaxID=1542911 RepID=A0ABW2UXX7_9BACI